MRRTAAVAALLIIVHGHARADDERMADGSPAWEYFARCSGAAFHESQWLAANQHAYAERTKAVQISVGMMKEARERLARDRGIDAGKATFIASDFVRRDARALDEADRAKTGLARPSWVRYIRCEQAYRDVVTGKTTWDAIVGSSAALPPLP